MKKLILTLLIAGSVSVFSQNVGINTTTPAATLDVVGKPGTTTYLDGFLAPRITAAQLSAKTYTAAQDGALVYVTDATTGTAQASNVSGIGYYYYSTTVNKWVKVTTGTLPTAIEPWYIQGSSTQSTSNTDNIYQTGKVSVGANATGGTLSVYNTASGATNNSLFYVQGLPNTATLTQPQYFNLMGNLTAGSYTALSSNGDQAMIFEVGNGGGAPYLSTGLIIGPHVNGGAGVPYGIKLTEQGLMGVNAQTPTETLHVNGTVRLKLPANGAANAIYTATNGSNSLGTSSAAIPAPTVTFTAANTVVADNNGVLGYVAGLPNINNGTAYLSGNTDMSSYTPGSLKKVYFFNAGTSITITMPSVTGNDGKELVFYIYGDPTTTETSTFTSSSAANNKLLNVANTAGWSVPDGITYSPNASGTSTGTITMSITADSQARKNRYHRRKLTFICDGSSWIFDHTMNW